ncbi:efflux transporter outer membrane subunit [Kozakia baliensis]|uniref:Uncharacterized protein n=1 Tax=Kozakia baliensis TaxID=153496 RepID=A0A1D8UT57_9PROT|nr:efflux transporter outer membrane subunit [Kozakia baliensis]AOX16835.1 hypothetical protein A0U89_06480 [Kozakia baliensis]GBR24365.1 RND efflux system outer membrane lipoprotein [Kozakia baliensis NRIC 0488]GEL64727.1 hypothetical protein KBA01_20130 [Kozakia baliensis]
MSFLKQLSLITSIGVLAGCTVGPDFRKPIVAAPNHWGEEPQDVASHTYGGQIDASWWRGFNDPELNSLVERLGRQNLELQRGLQRIVQAQSQIRIAASQGLPSLNWAGSYTYTHQSESGFISLVQPRPGAPNEYNFFQNTLSASWDLDLFGQVRRATETQRANREAAIEARHGIALSTVSTLADTYMQLRGVQEQIAITERNLAVTQHDLKLVQDRFGNGVGTILDLAQARAQVASTAAALPPLHNSESQLINAIGLLLAEPPRALTGELTPRKTQPPVPPQVPVGVPSELARRRPDIREAEARLHAATAEIGVATAAFYPDITLTGQMGTQTLSAADFFALPARQFANGPTLSVPLFEGGRLRGTLNLRKAQQKEAVLAFHQAVLNAWNEVDNTLTAYAQAQRQRVQTLEALMQDRQALTAAQQRYREGAVNFLEVDNAESAALASEAALAANQTTIETNLIALYRALGGGWEYAENPQNSDRKNI